MILTIILALAPTPAPTPAGPCSTGAIASISDRPGIGRAPATNGSACVVLPRGVVFEAGYRNQITAGSGTQNLATFPNLVVRIGLHGHNEVLVAPPFLYSRRGGQNATSGLQPLSGEQDAGIGFKHMLHDKPWMQDAVNLFVTLPTGHPNNASGFSAGLPTYTLGYSAVVPVNARLSFATTDNAILNAAPGSTGAPQRFFALQTALIASYAFSPNVTMLAQDQLSLPNGTGSGTGNRALAGFQCTLSPNVVLDADLEWNLLPLPMSTQHAIDIGVTVQI